jgi:hypothetical protein
MTPAAATGATFMPHRTGSMFASPAGCSSRAQGKLALAARVRQETTLPSRGLPRLVSAITTRPNHSLPRQDLHLRACQRLKAAHRNLLLCACSY